MNAVAVKNKTFNKMVNVINKEDISYNAIGKAEFKRSSMSALRQIAKDLLLSESNVSFNAGGIAVSGDAILKGMWADGNGIYININADHSGKALMYRTITHMKDYRGGGNQWASINNASDNYEEFIESLLRLKR